MTYPNKQIGCLCLPTEQREPRRTPDAPFRYIDIFSCDDHRILPASTDQREGAAPSV